MGRCLSALRRPQARRTRTRIGGNFFRAGLGAALIKLAKTGLRADNIWLVTRWPTGPTRARREKLFDDAVFQRMEGNHSKSALRLQNLFSRLQATDQFTKLIIEVNPQGLKTARRWMRLFRAWLAENTTNQIGQLAGAG